MTQQRGFSLIEALIALVVLSIGLIGVAAMQLKALQSATAGYQRSVASVAAVDAQERLWAELAKDEVDSCVNINLEEFQERWKDDWFADSGSKPLRNENGGESSIERGRGEDECQFTVVVVLNNDENDQFDYTFRLPRLEAPQ